ncbi:MAG TPA: hypothetical protein VND93_21575 [Myxococcales bacterium]|nr:hypothetical protein [Myxococcales bacterium]
MDVIPSGGSEAVLDAGGLFDVPAALRLAQEIARLPPSASVVIDFVRTRECHDFALAALSQALVRMAGLGPQVKTRGLNQHHARVLRYLDAPAGLLA